jgi:hypothetical protein
MAAASAPIVAAGDAGAQAPGPLAPPPQNPPQTPPTAAGGRPQPAEPRPAASGSSSDELTDADFGTSAPEVAVAAPERRIGFDWLDLAVGIALSSRRFDFVNAPGMAAARPPRFTSGWSWRPNAALEIRPLARRMRARPLEGLGVFAEYGRTVARASSSDPDRARESRLEVGISYRIAIGTRDTQPTFGATAGYVRQQVQILDGSIDLPDVDYDAIGLAVDIRVPVVSPRVSLCASARYLVVWDGGELTRPEMYGDGRAAGLELGAALEIRPFSPFFLRLHGGYTRYSIEFDGSGMLGGPGAVGATDQYKAANLSTGIDL